MTATMDPGTPEQPTSGRAATTTGATGATSTGATGAAGEAAAAGAPPPPRSLLRIEIAGRTIWQVIGAILLTIALLRMARAASGLLSMVALAFFFSLALDPAVRWLHNRYGWRRGAAVGVIYMAGLVFIAVLVFILVPAIGQLADRVAENGDEWVARLNAWTSENLGVPLDRDVGTAVSGAGEE
ncbi:MAG TPA: AI-2E family transporter, partial [Euzebyales bacterium]|nr:AI-2E family transporter [Euzebyales bacterium]